MKHFYLQFLKMSHAFLVVYLLFCYCNIFLLVHHKYNYISLEYTLLIVYGLIKVIKCSVKVQIIYNIKANFLADLLLIHAQLILITIFFVRSTKKALFLRDTLQTLQFVP